MRFPFDARIDCVPDEDAYFMRVARAKCYLAERVCFGRRTSPNTILCTANKETGKRRSPAHECRNFATFPDTYLRHLFLCH
jgi:hypothetical protein